MKDFYQVQFWCVDSGQQPNTTHTTLPLAHPFSCGMGKKKRKAKRLVDCNNDNFIRIAKMMCASKAKYGIHSLHLIDKQMFRHCEAEPQYTQRFLENTNAILKVFSFPFSFIHQRDRRKCRKC